MTISSCEDANCAICLSLFSDPVVIESCQHCFCRECIEAVLKKCEAGSCPLCRQHYDLSSLKTMEDQSTAAAEINRLTRCLVEWPVFEKLYDENNVALMKLWRKAGGYKIAAKLYTDSLKDLAIVSSDEEVADKKWKVAHFLFCAGQYNEAEKLLIDAIKLEEEKLGKRKQRMADLWQLLCDIKSSLCKLIGFTSPSDGRKHYQVIKIASKALSLRKKLRGNNNKYKLGLIELQISFHYGVFCELGRRYKDLSVEGSRRKCESHCQKALKIFKKLNDSGHIAETVQNMASFIYNHDDPAQIKLYRRALKLSIQSYGECHQLTGRILFNIGTCIEHRNQRKSYDYFKRAYNIDCEIFGPTHPITQRVRNVLNGSAFRLIAAEKQAETNFQELPSH